MGIATSIGTLVGGVLGCELGLAAGRAAAADQLPANGIRGVEVELIRAGTGAGTLIGSIGGFAVGGMIDGTNKMRHESHDEL